MPGKPAHVNFLAFKLALRDEVDVQVKRNPLLFKQFLALEVLTGIVRRTPVDTGRARANWQVSRKIPQAVILRSVDKAAGFPTIQKGKRVIDQSRAGEDIWICNDLPYIIP